MEVGRGSLGVRGTVQRQYQGHLPPLSYSASTKIEEKFSMGIHLHFIIQAIAPLGWRVTASMDVASKNLDSNDRYSYEGQSEDMHTWFFLYDEKIAAKHDTEQQKQVSNKSKEEENLNLAISFLGQQ